MGSLNELEYHLLLARELKPLKATANTELAHHTTEVETDADRLIQKLTAGR
jgi:hypothetical protein